MDTGIKYDQDKPRFDLISPEFITGVAVVSGYGAVKYADRNWEKGMKWGRPFAAAMRHMWAWWRGERLDPESGLPHLYHAACNIMYLATYEERGVGLDDRFVMVAPSTEAIHEKVVPLGGGIVHRHLDINSNGGGS